MLWLGTSKWESFISGLHCYSAPKWTYDISSTLGRIPLPYCRNMNWWKDILQSVWPDWAFFKGLGDIFFTKAVQIYANFFKKNGPILASFSLFSSFQYTVDSKQMFNINKFLPMTGFEPRTSGFRSNRSTNWATTTALICANFKRYFKKSLFT